MKCACGKELGPINYDGMCLECFNNRNKEEYCRTEKLHTGWICPKCGYVWAIWVEGCKNCNQPKYFIETTGASGDIGNGIKTTG